MRSRGIEMCLCEGIIAPLQRPTALSELIHVKVVSAPRHYSFLATIQLLYNDQKGT